MAQMSSKRLRRVRVLSRRYGLWGPKGVALGCVAVLLVLGAFGLARALASQPLTVERGASATQEDAAAQKERTSHDETAQKATQELLVHVDGAVGAPGVYRVTGANPRVNDAVELAGGLTEDADTTGINLAAPLEDGQKIYVPKVGEEGANNASAQVSGQSPSVTTSSGQEQGLVNINTATAKELQQLEGVGEATSADIVADREANGPFASPEDIMRVSGIGQKKYEKMKDQLCV